MGWIITSIIITAAAFVAAGYCEEKKEKIDKWGDIKLVETIVWKINTKQILALLALAIMMPAFIAKVPANTVGIVYSAFTGTKEETLGEGFHSKSPFEKVYKISTEVQTMTVDGVTTQTKDAQYLTSALDIKYRVSSDKAYLVFTQFRSLDKMTDSLIAPTTQRVMELITTQYNVIDVLGERRSAIYTELEAKLAEELEKYGVEFYSVTINDMDAGEAIEAAITAEAVAKKAVETAEQELLKAETEAKKKSVNAKSEQDAAKIEAETKVIQAQAEREANELLQQSLTDEILMQQWIDKWNGQTPEYYGGDGADLIFNTGKIAE